MSSKYLGETFDIHGGGMDLQATHHTNEIAQSQACNHTAPANYWLHTNMLTVNGVRMSKSAGNGFLPKELFAGSHPLLDKGYSPMRRSIEIGFKQALNAIIDSNVTTLLTGIILVIFGQGPIKGFGVTLSFGILTTFITAVFLTRYMVEGYAKRETAKELPFHTKLSEHWLQNTKIDFMSIRKYMYVLSGALFLISFISFGVRGFSLGIDFSGGRNYVVNFEHPVKTEAIRSLLEKAFEGDLPQVITIGNDNQVRISTKYKINEHVHPSLSVFLQEKIDIAFNSYLNNLNNFDYKPSLLHNDLSGNHILINVNDKQVEGIIDFGDMAIGDPDYDLTLLFAEFGENFINKLLQFYNRPNSSTLIEKLKFFNLANVLLRIQRLIIAKDEHEIKDEMIILQNWILKYYMY